MKRRITKIGHPVDCFHCGQLVEYPGAHFEAAPGVGKDPETFCDPECFKRSCKNREGQNRPQPEAREQRPPLQSVAVNLMRARRSEAQKRAAANATLQAAIAEARAKGGGNGI